MQASSWRSVYKSTFSVEGTGKTLMALMLRDAMFYKQHETKYFHFISAAEFYPFPKDANDILEYKTKFREKIRQAVHGCERALIVIDDLHLLSVQLLDTLAPFLCSKEQVDGISYRKAIFILTSLYGDSGLIQFAADYHRKVSRMNFITIPDLKFSKSPITVGGVYNGVLYNDERL